MRIPTEAPFDKFSASTSKAPWPALIPGIERFVASGATQI